MFFCTPNITATDTVFLSWFFFQGRGARVFLRRDDPAITNLGTRILKPRMRRDRGRAELDEDLAAESGFR